MSLESRTVVSSLIATWRSKTSSHARCTVAKAPRPISRIMVKRPMWTSPCTGSVVGREAAVDPTDIGSVVLERVSLGGEGVCPQHLYVGVGGAGGGEYPYPVGTAPST